METNTIALQFIKSVSKPKEVAYLNKQGRLAIGYNHTSNVHKASSCSLEEAEKLLQKDISCSINVLYHHFPYQLNRWRVASLTCLIHEITLETFLRSKLYQYLKEKNYKLAEKEFTVYHLEYTSVLRRLQEQNLFSYKGKS
jgi:GH24 family phage-related lysozyme (muramidase)